MVFFFNMTLSSRISSKPANLSLPLLMELVSKSKIALLFYRKIVLNVCCWLIIWSRMIWSVKLLYAYTVLG